MTRKQQRTTYKVPEAEYLEGLCQTIFAASEGVDSSSPENWTEGNQNWWN